MDNENETKSSSNSLFDQTISTGFDMKSCSKGTLVLEGSPEQFDYKLVIECDPKPQGRPRTRIVQSKVAVAELVRNLKARIALIGHEFEPDGWSTELLLMDEVLEASMKKSFATIYEDKKDKEAKDSLMKAVKQYAPLGLLDGPLRVDIYFYFARPKYHYRTGKYSNEIKPDAPTMHITKPDRDNLDKLVLDALTGIFWKDDSQVCQGWLEKQYSERPRLEIFIKKLN